MGPFKVAVAFDLANILCFFFLVSAPRDVCHSKAFHNGVMPFLFPTDRVAETLVHRYDVLKLLL
jgi:hypothetical protein